MTTRLAITVPGDSVDLDGLTSRVILKAALMFAVILILAAALVAIIIRAPATSPWSRVRVR